MSKCVNHIQLLTVYLDFNEPVRIGRLAYVNREIVFEFDKNFPVDELNISPFHLKPSLTGGIIKGPERLFEGLHGVFNDSLPDGWGRLLMDRTLSRLDIRPGQVTPLDRLAWVGSRGMGALVYKPEHPNLSEYDDNGNINLDEMAEAVKLVLEDSPEAVFKELLKVGGSPGGARPKALVGLSPDGRTMIHGEDQLDEGYEYWLVKFCGVDDSPETGLIEKAYADMAVVAGIDMPETRVFPSNNGPGYFGIKRFDRGADGRKHMHTACGLLNADFRLPSIGYEDLLKATSALTRHQEDVNQMFLRMVFNVFAHNRDDHTKNHAFLMDETGEWRLSPAYDMVFSDGPGGEHALDVGGEGRNPGIDDIRRVGKNLKLGKKVVEGAISQVRAAVDLWPSFAGGNGVSEKTIQAISSEIHKQNKG
ncbi:type II toxin-antitoxin system HipA family toxin [Pseudodesulfovibrio portus]|uniref:Toxin HipA n=1 Tax=Pseudodesulfovibrio portus TaxID=231439 RepID=A0ABM8AVG9_9BACT|nr:type II toxin-antitoxin system HipA family toxin [Pseudodesulfovibrio portus]BDQ35462.1 toxin HipA [Pseudodesulfovibrio portus]